MLISVVDSLNITKDKFYKDYGFAEVFASLKRAPETLKNRIGEIPGVDKVETRVDADVKLDIKGFPEPVTARLVSVPDIGSPLLNMLYIREGRMIDPPWKDNEVVVSEAFAEAHRFKPGDSFGAVISGRWKTLVIVGTALSPEFIFQARPGAIIPDYKRHAILWMGRNALSAAYDMEGAFNDVALTISDDAILNDVIIQLDGIIDRYGGLGSYGRKDQISHRFLREDLRALQRSAEIFPPIFIAVTAFLLNVVISRARLRFGHISYLTSIYGIEADNSLRFILDMNLEPIHLPPDGVVLTDYLGHILGVKPGDMLTVEVLEGNRPVRQVPVIALIKEYIGLRSYMDLSALNRLMREGNAISGAYLSLDSLYQQDIYRSLIDMPRVVGTVVREDEIRNFYEAQAEALLFFIFVASILAGTIAFGVVYNSARIALSERSRELASLRVLGYTRAEISYIFLGQLGLLTLAAIPLGFILGKGLCNYIAIALSSDLFRIPAVVEPATYSLADGRERTFFKFLPAPSFARINTGQYLW